MDYRCPCGAVYEVLNPGTFQCRHCGRVYDVYQSLPDRAQGKPWMKDATTTAPPAPPPKRTTRPARAASVQSEVVVPLLISLISGLIGLIATLLVDTIPGLAVPPLVYAIAGGLTTCVVWFLLVTDHYKSLLRIVEEPLSFGLEIPEPEPVSPQHVEFTINSGHSILRGELPCPKGDWLALSNFCQGIINGSASFSERGSGSIQGAKHYGYNLGLWEDLRAEFIKRQWAYWKNDADHTKGTEFTHAGKQIIKELAKI